MMDVPRHDKLARVCDVLTLCSCLIFLEPFSFVKPSADGCLLIPRMSSMLYDGGVLGDRVVGEGVLILAGVVMYTACVGSLESRRDVMEECTLFCPLAALALLDRRIRLIVLAEGTLLGHMPSSSSRSLISQANMLGLAFL